MKTNFLVMILQSRAVMIVYVISWYVKLILFYYIVIVHVLESLVSQQYDNFKYKLHTI